MNRTWHTVLLVLVTACVASSITLLAMQAARPSAVAPRHHTPSATAPSSPSTTTATPPPSPPTPPPPPPSASPPPPPSPAPPPSTRPPHGSLFSLTTVPAYAFRPMDPRMTPEQRTALAAEQATPSGLPNAMTFELQIARERALMAAADAGSQHPVADAEEVYAARAAALDHTPTPHHPWRPSDAALAAHAAKRDIPHDRAGPCCPSPCFNAGVCSLAPGSPGYTCKCHGYWSGLRCDELDVDALLRDHAKETGYDCRDEVAAMDAWERGGKVGPAGTGARCPTLGFDSAAVMGEDMPVERVRELIAAMPATPIVSFERTNVCAMYHLEHVRGVEARQSITFFLDFWDELPASMVLLHNKLTEWHRADGQPSMAVAHLRHARWHSLTSKVRSIAFRSGPYDPGAPTQSASGTFSQYVSVEKNNDITNRVLPALARTFFDVKPFPVDPAFAAAVEEGGHDIEVPATARPLNHQFHACCAQFIVSSSAVLRRPRAHWQYYLAVAVNLHDTKPPGEVINNYFSPVWPLALTSPLRVSPNILCLGSYIFCPNGLPPAYTFDEW